MDENHNADVMLEIPEALVQHRRSFSLIWLVPLVALLIGGWLAVKAFTEKGPTVTIAFEDANGLEAGKTKIKYKEVEIGQVESIRLSEDASHVIVHADMVKQAEDFLTESTRFWVVRARVTGGGKSRGWEPFFQVLTLLLIQAKTENPLAILGGLKYRP